MSDDKTERHPKVFISYSWTTPDHEDWTLNLSERLMSNGVDVVIDKWYLKEGQDKYHFMESMVVDETVEKVLIILDKAYRDKANSRKGGVGTETQIISPEVYSKVSQTKFIPIVAEKDQNGDPYVPSFLKGRIYIDLSDQELYEAEYDKLLRNIYSRPLHQKPVLGEAPSHIFEDRISTAPVEVLR